MKNIVKKTIKYFFSNDIIIWLYLRLRKKHQRIILYHGVSDLEYEKRSFQVIPREVFVKQIEYLRKHYINVPLSGVITGRNSGTVLPKNSITITFDDAYENNYLCAFPILMNNGFTATVFVNPKYTAMAETGQKVVFWWDLMDYLMNKSNYLKFISIFDSNGIKLESSMSLSSLKVAIERILSNADADLVERVTEDMKRCFAKEITSITFPAVMNWQQLKNLNEKGIEIGSHTMSHVAVSRLSPDKFSDELVVPKIILEEKLGKKVNAFAFPFGGQEHYSLAALETLKGVGYKCALLTTGFEKDDFCFSRTSIAKNDDFRTFKIKVSGIYDDIRSIANVFGKIWNAKN